MNLHPAQFSGLVIGFIASWGMIYVILPKGEKRPGESALYRFARSIAVPYMAAGTFTACLLALNGSVALGALFMAPCFFLQACYLGKQFTPTLVFANFAAAGLFYGFLFVAHILTKNLAAALSTTTF